jgi:hypothetical protein
MNDSQLPAVAIDHVGIAAHTDSLPLASMLGGVVLGSRSMPSGVTVAHFGPERMLELVWPHAGTGPVTNFLARRGPGLHHLALAVEVPLAELGPQLACNGVRLAGEIEPSSDGRPSLFVHPSSTGGVLVELVQGRR